MQLVLETFVKGILGQQLNFLGRAITLVESTLKEHQQFADQVLEQILPHTGQSIRLGISGPPGVGKSTFIEAFGQLFVEAGNKLAILAIDPSSQRSQGSILGDKTRMEALATHPNVFIRPSPAGTASGGVNHHTRESILLCEAAGYDIIIVETVGVGQSEVVVRQMVDYFLLLAQPGAGDELQGIKRGIMELADGIAITKSDGRLLADARIAQKSLESALHYQIPLHDHWRPEVFCCSALENKGLTDVYQNILNFIEQQKASGELDRYRQTQRKNWWIETLRYGLIERFFQSPYVKKQLAELEQEVIQGNMLPKRVAQQLLKLYFSNEPIGNL